jgi:glycosyltransferase involved in cell wall biosynthesis
MAQRILILSRTPIGKQMSSPGIRYVNMRRVLREALPGAQVDLAAPEGYRVPGSQEYEVVYYNPLRILDLVRNYDVVIGMSFPMALAVSSPFLRRPVLILDFFSQFHFEWIELGRDLLTGAHRRVWTRAGQMYADLQLAIADFIVCANDRQRDSFLGILASQGLVTANVYAQDPSLRRLIDVVPHGVRPEPFPGGPGGVKGAFPGIDRGDTLLLWLGGILYWYDPITLLRALARVRKIRPDVKLLFLGTHYPGREGIGVGRRLEEAIDQAKALGLWENGVYMSSEWLSQEAVVPFLQDADAGVTTYFTNAETRFAHRTRFQDYIWAGLPIICTQGDVLADEVAARQWGIAVRESDEDAVYAAVMRIVEDKAFVKQCRENLAQAASEMTWESAFEPLVQFLRRGAEAPIAEPRRKRWFPILRASAAYAAVRALERGFDVLERRRARQR